MLLFITVLQCKASFVCYMMCTVTTLTGANDAQDTRTAYTVVKYKGEKKVFPLCVSLNVSVRQEGGSEKE